MGQLQREAEALRLERAPRQVARLQEGLRYGGHGPLFVLVLSTLCRPGESRRSAVRTLGIQSRRDGTDYRTVVSESLRRSTYSTVRKS
jgi:hypothetical protein